MEIDFGSLIVNGLWTTFAKFAVDLVIALAVFVAGFFVIKLFAAKIIPKMLKKSKITPEIHHFIVSLFKLVCYVILVLGCINILGFQTASIIAVLGALAVAVGMSLQGSVANFAGGVMLLIFKPFKQGDYIIPSYDEKAAGYVVNVGLLYTFVRTVDNKMVMLPNGKLSDSTITNFDKEEKRQLRIEFDIPYETDLKEIKILFEKAMRTNKYVLQEEDISTVVKTLGSNGIQIQCRSWIKSEDYWPAYFEMQEILITVLKENNINVPFNQMDVHIKTDDTNIKNKKCPDLRSNE